MPDSNVPRDADATPDESATPDETATPEETPAGAESAEADEPAGFENRAARRARGKGAPQQQPHGKARNFGGRGSVQNPRQYGNRRSG
jgi:hypothetical protein